MTVLKLGAPGGQLLDRRKAYDDKGSKTGGDKRATQHGSWWPVVATLGVKDLSARIMEGNAGFCFLKEQACPGSRRGG